MFATRSRQLAGASAASGWALSAATAAALMAPAVSASTGTVLTSWASGIFLVDFFGLRGRDQAQDARGARGDHAGELLLDLEPVRQVAGLAGGGAGDAQRDRTRDDGRGQEDRRDHATDDAPLEALAGAVVGHLLDVDLAVVVALGDEHGVDVERSVDLGGQQLVVDRDGRARVGKAGHDEGVVALGGDGAFGNDALFIGDLGRDDDDVVGSRGVGVLVGHVDPFPLSLTQEPAWSRPMSSGPADGM